MTSVGGRELRQRASELLSLVERGEVIEITDRGRPVALLSSEIRSSLHQAGFTIDHLYGGWQREPIGDGDGELLVIARVAG